ncbi:dual 3',5'-cyclic-AMP and -GMP phosphodiesterase 11 [Caerostris extrusa]|uniref:Dual 3',5'-cyclic-AMP and -GMP phosphodiesterase 11 n=1 Tax=Caerostris extrusa TaxID=172846 RepID=A0AAV4SWC3_CAEEX|nr:dual 3',5'-cyclic-AMP and -GMP phosphodiesterase 11 [Caerostris extrusa]
MRCLVNQLFDVSRSSTIEQMQRKEEIRIPWGNGIVGHVAEYRESLNIPDCYKDGRFCNLVDRRTGYKTRNMLCMPILDADGEVKGVAQIINKCEERTFHRCRPGEHSSRFLPPSYFQIPNAGRKMKFSTSLKEGHVNLFGEELKGGRDEIKANVFGVAPHN